MGLFRIINYKKYLKYIVFVVLIVFLATISQKGYNYIKEQRKGFKNDILLLEEKNKTLQDSIFYFKNNEKELNVIEKSYYNEYLYEKNKRIKAEKALYNIRFLVFDRKYLDSLAKNIRFN